MQYSTTLLAAVFATAGANAHMLLAAPAPWKNGDNSPLKADGSDFPCKMGDGVTSAGAPVTVMAPGSDQPLQFTGGASHGGGSCQISVTTDTTPTKSSQWKVIKSFIGGCPAHNQQTNIGNSAAAPDPDTYTFQVPSDMPAGEYALAWTWQNRIGNREFYMNCASIKVGSGSSKRDALPEHVLAQKRADFLSSLPDMFVANINVPQANSQCTQESNDLSYPNPGKQVQVFGNGPFKGPGKNTGGAMGGTTPCAGTDVTAPVSSGGSPAGPPSGSSGAASSAVAPSAGSSANNGQYTAPAAGTPTAGAGQATATGAAGAAATPSGKASGGVFLPTSVGGSAATATAASSPSATTPAAPASTGSYSGGSSGGSSSSSGNATGKAFASGSACQSEGAWNCVGGSSFQQCGSGTWSPVQQMAAGMSCETGMGSALKMNAVVVKPAGTKRAIRFSPAHLRRGHAASF